MEIKTTHVIEGAGGFIESRSLYINYLNDDSSLSISDRARILNDFDKELDAIATKAFNIGIEHQKEQQK